MIAVLRYQLLDIRLVVSRFALYLLLSATGDRRILGLITVLDRALGGEPDCRGVRGHRAGARSDLQSPAGLAAAPHRPAVLWLAQDPARAVAEVGSRLGEHASAAPDLKAR